MKKLLIIVVALTIAVSVSAQGHYRWHGGYGSRIVVVGGYAPYYPYYDPFYYPRYYQVRPTKLDMKIEDIQYEYSEKIKAARHDKGIPRKERRAEIRELKHEREQAIMDAKRSYYRHG